MTRDIITVSVDVRCFDKRGIIKAARDDCRAKKVTPGHIANWRDAVQWLIDPGHLPGCDILESRTE